ncbi:tRNA uridine-5-carboxymethylaminomethyl(34) synthesis GTPase MnmE [Persephonella atlantica]|uniref:tRNA modification GTPase MnmE n=1 Tax=Persephonella atlantica TaxID=2699429 RepID=A0ABS1GK99_9AQUI|nr:tRNA uridine-5-carboxymethylaminomethyl(34) synthesis GTPase MnmE [Persephonella atlantica]MBK3333353.1 tRNA uridine-5-carboxymethylaminomethyl(34) synthesis GTPase MnmE [Persephonella atlantica]
MYEKDTIVANATPLIPSAVGIVRISGEKALQIGKKLFTLPEKVEERKAYYGKIKDRKGEIIDEGLLLFFKAPRSFTGEDVVEIYPHGSVPVIKKILQEAIYFGARFAQPGEFTKRAFLNGKIDLTQAEAIAELIEAKTERATKAAVNLLEGKLSKKVNQLREELMHLISLIEAEINFPEDVEEIDEETLKMSLKSVLKKIEELLKTYRKGEIIREGIKLAIVGRPNVGKSSLFNAFVGYERAIVSEFEGTTRDFLEESLSINGIPVKLLDTAGIRETENKVEKIGIEKALQKIEEADVVLFVFDLSSGITEEDMQIYEKIKNKNPIIVGNKLDLVLDKNNEKYYFNDVIPVSSKTLQNFDQLEEKILQKLNLLEEADTDIYINLRHYELLKKAKEVIERVLKDFEYLLSNKEILMLEISEAERALEEITGEITTEDILGNIFSKFCIGK